MSDYEEKIVGGFMDSMGGMGVGTSAISLGITMLIVLLTRVGNAEDLTFEEAMKAWSFMAGEWTMHSPNGTTSTLSCAKGDNSSCFLIRVGDYHGIATYDGAEKEMMTFGSHPEGTHSIGHWTMKSPKSIEGSFTVTRADGSKEKHTGRFEILGEDEYTQAVFKAEHRSCVAAVARVVVLMVALQRRVSSDTGAYCRARAKLPEVVLQRLTLQLADGCEDTVPTAWQWHARRTYLVDGTTVSMHDTPANHAAWPQPKTQQKGLGFPLMRLVVLMSLATAMRSSMAMGPYAGKETGETALFRSLLHRLQPGDVFVADRYSRHQDQHGPGRVAVPFAPPGAQRNLDRPVGL